MRKLLERICRILGYINPLIPKNEKKILIFNSKPDYMNNYAIYKYLVENKYNEIYHIYYSMPGIQNNIKKKKNVYLFDSKFKSLLLYLTSKFVFFDTGNIRIRPSMKQMVYNSWHGTPLKRIGFLSKNCEKDLPKNLMNSFSKISVSSSYFDEIYKLSFNLNENQICHIGQPRNDLLFSKNIDLNKIGIDTDKYTQIIAWMTTYRISYDNRLIHTSNESWSQTNLPVLVDEEKLFSINETLKSYNQLLIIKIHGTSKSTDFKYHNFSNLVFIKESDYIKVGLQLYEILARADILITDYSSVSFDYLNLNRPIGFIIDDIEDYQEKNGFSVNDVLDFMPGEKITTLEELKNFFKKCNLFIDEYRDERISVNSIVNEFTFDNMARTLEYVGINKNK